MVTMSHGGREDLSDDDAKALADDLVRFFHGLTDEARGEYGALADADRRFGEDVAAERREEGRQ
jgi:hypothetical protein